jgi:release factor glutamine methyltransferase
MSLILKDLLNMAEKRFQEEDCLTPRLDAELLFCHMLQKDKNYLFLHHGDQIDEKTCESYFQLVDIRAGGMPVQYMTGKQEFMGLSFRVNENVLIPRQDTETLVETAISQIKSKKSTLRGLQILDLCCGSGAIAISLAHHLKQTKLKIAASDISQEAIAVAKENATSHGVAGNIDFFQGDLFEPFPKNRKGKGKKQFDWILCNPPYIRRDVLPTLMREVKDHEPLLALDGGVDGLDFYRRILLEAPAYLKPGGWLLMEIGYDQGEDLALLATTCGVYEPITILPDLAGRDRIAMATVKA